MTSWTGIYQQNLYGVLHACTHVCTALAPHLFLTRLRAWHACCVWLSVPSKRPNERKAAQVALKLPCK